LPWNEFGPMINESNNCTQHDHLKEHMIWESLSWRIKFPAGSHCTATSPDPLYLYAHSDEEIIFSEDESSCILPQVVESDLVTGKHLKNRPGVLQVVNMIEPIIITPRFPEVISAVDENSIESSTRHFIQPDEFLNTATISTAKTPKTSQDFSIRMFGSRETHIDVTKTYCVQMFHYACSLTLTRTMLWLDALKETVEYYQYSGLGVFTLRNKFQDFQKHNYMLPHPNSLKVDSQGKVVRSKEIFFLDIYPDLKLVFQAYARENIRRISVDLMHLYTNDTIIPLLKDEILAGIENNASATSESEDSIDETINKIIQKQHGFRKCIVCRETVSYESG